MAGSAEQRRVWSWWAREEGLGMELVFVAAVHDRGDLSALCDRAEVARPWTPRFLRSVDVGFTEALRQPTQLLWMPLEQFAARGRVWFNEQQLRAARGATRSPFPR